MLSKMDVLQAERHDLLRAKEGLQTELDNLTGKFAEEENIKLDTLKEKVEVESAMDELKKTFEAKNTTLEVANAQAKESLGAIEKDLASVEKKFQKNYKVGMNWKENCFYRIYFIVDMYF